MQTDVSNNKDQVVVSFHNTTDFDFTPEMGCMYDGRAINGISGTPGIVAGEKKLLPYHIGVVLARNLAKRVFNTSIAATVDQSGIPTGVAVWNPDKLHDLAVTYITEEYSDIKPIAMTETEKLMAKVAELERFMKEKLSSDDLPAETKTEAVIVESKVDETTTPKVFLDKQEVIVELEKRNIAHDKRKKKDELERLLA